MICLESSLRQYAEGFRGVFSSPQFQHFVTVLLGFVLSPQRCTLTGLQRRVAGSHSVSALSRFFSDAPWSCEELAHKWLTRFRQQLMPQIKAEHARQRAERPRRRGKPRRSQVTAFVIFDDTTVPKHTQGKQGRRMAGVGKHYSSLAKGIVHGHSQIVSMIALLGRRCPLPPLLYRQKSVADAEGVPFQSKVELVTHAVGTLKPVPGTKTHILVDAWYTCRSVWRTALQRNFAITGGLRINRWLRLPDPLHPRSYRKIQLSTYLAGLQPDDFVMVPWRGRGVAAHLVRTFVYKLGACQVLVIKGTPQTPVHEARCWATSDLKADVATVASYAAQRWDIETWIEDAKEVLGLDHYQLTSVTSVMRFLYLLCSCYLFLDEVRVGLVAKGHDGATIGHASRHLHQAHDRRLLKWLHQQFAQGSTVNDIQTLLAA